MTPSHRRTLQAWLFLAPALLLLATLMMSFVAAGPARAQQAAVKLPNVVILATGGTIAGSGADSTTTVGYTSATVGVERLILAPAAPWLPQPPSRTGS